MTEEKWLDEYSGQTTEELLALEGEDRTDSLVLAFEQALGRKADRIGQDGLTGEEKVVLAIEALEREVNNGGYDQFFINSSKEYASIVVDALNRIGCGDTALLTQQAVDILGIHGDRRSDRPCDGRRDQMIYEQRRNDIFGQPPGSDR